MLLIMNQMLQIMDLLIINNITNYEQILLFIDKYYLI